MAKVYGKVVPIKETGVRREVIRYVDKEDFWNGNIVRHGYDFQNYKTYVSVNIGDGHRYVKVRNVNKVSVIQENRNGSIRDERL